MGSRFLEEIAETKEKNEVVNGDMSIFTWQVNNLYIFALACINTNGVITVFLFQALEVPSILFKEKFSRGKLIILNSPEKFGCRKI